MDTIMKACLETYTQTREATGGVSSPIDAKNFFLGLRELRNNVSSQADAEKPPDNVIDSDASPTDRDMLDPTVAVGTAGALSKQTEVAIELSRRSLDILLAEWEQTWQSDFVSRTKDEDNRKMEMLYRANPNAPVTRESIQPILDFLQKDLPESPNWLRFSKWLSKRHPTEEAVQAFLALVPETVPLSDGKVKLIVRILVNLLCSHHSQSIDASITSYLNALPRSETYPKLLASLVEVLCAHEQGPVWLEGVPPRVERWLGIMRSLQQTLSVREWDVQYRALLRRVKHLRQLQSYFSPRTNTTIAWILFYNWIFRPAVPLSTDHALTRAEHDSSVDSDIPLKDRLRPKFQAMMEAAVREPGKNDMLVELLGLLRASVSHESAINNMAYEILDLLKCFRTPSELKVFYDRMRDHPQLGVTPEFRISLIQHYVSIGESYYAWHVFDHSPALLLDSTCYELPLLMIEKGEIGSARIMEMLTGRYSGVEAHNTWVLLAPPAFGPVVHPDEGDTRRRKQSLTEIVDLVHLMALAWSESPHVSDRTSFRRVWECYRFLTDRGIKPRSSIVRALITAGLIRTVRRTGRGLVLTKMKYIIDLIRRMESDAEAVLFEEKLQALLAQNAVHHRALLQRLAKEARRRATDGMDPAVVKVDRKRQAQRAKYRAVPIDSVCFIGSELERRAPPKSLAKLPDGSLLKTSKKYPPPWRVPKSTPVPVAAFDPTHGYGE
jgi:hypothetical protein